MRDVAAGRKSESRLPPRSGLQPCMVPAHTQSPVLPYGPCAGTGRCPHDPHGTGLTAFSSTHWSLPCTVQAYATAITWLGYAETRECVMVGGGVT